MTLPEPKRFAVACGGTGGHVFPGLAVANELRSRGHEVEAWLAGRDVESSALCAWDGSVFRTKAKPLVPRNALSLAASIWRCLRHIKKFRPDALLAMGSYSSLPPVLAARMTGVPVVLHEANAVPGKAVEFLARYAKYVAVSFPNSEKHFPRNKTELTGLPVRNDLVDAKPFEDIPRDAFKVFVTGGSQGARRVNEIASAGLALLGKEAGDKLFVMHQFGRDTQTPVAETYSKAGVRCRTEAFVSEMGRAFASADFVIARAGASTCFELALVGKPALFIPLPSAMRDHQRLNADAMSAAGGADVAIQSELSPEGLAGYIRHKMQDPLRLKQMSLAMKSLAKPEAAARVAQILERL